MRFETWLSILFGDTKRYCEVLARFGTGGDVESRPVSKLVLALTLLASATAFQAQQRTARTVVRMATDVNDMVGVGPESGWKVWDPMSFGSVSKVVGGEHYSFMPDVKWLREAEIKHGRVCMLAFVGTCAAANNVVFPGDLGGLHYEACKWDEGLPSALSTNPVGIAQLFLAIGIIEGTFFPAEFWVGGGDREAGDLGFLPFGDAKKNGRDMKELEVSELKNGRLAMLAMAAFFSAHQLPGSVPFLPPSI